MAKKITGVNKIIDKDTKLSLDEGIKYGYSGTKVDKNGKTKYIGKGDISQYKAAMTAGNVKMDDSGIGKKVKNVLPNEGLMDPEYIRTNMFTKFSKFGFNDPYDRLLNTKEVLFFTKPDLNIIDNSTGKLNDWLKNSPFFIDLAKNYNGVIHELQSSYTKDATSNKNLSPFMMILHNRVKDTLDLPDITSNDIDISANMYGNDYSYRGSSEPSDDQHTFNLEFEDTKFLDVYMLFRAYEEYERYKRLGRVAPDDRYIMKKVLHDQISIFKFVLAEDFSTIVHYSKLWGCYPTGVPRSAFGTNDFSSSGLSLSIPWKCAFVEDMNPTILQDFNDLMSKYLNGNKLKSDKYKILPQSADNGRINRHWAVGAMVSRKQSKLVGVNKSLYHLDWIGKK